MYPHNIRLRGPWEFQADGPSSAWQRVLLPDGWASSNLAAMSGALHCRRRFGSPSGLDRYERVWLRCVGLASSAQVSLNDKPVSLLADGTVEVTSLLLPRNELTLLLAPQTSRPQPWDEIALEIRCTAYLVSVQMRADLVANSLHVQGVVVGECERALDLYLLGLGKTLAYRSLAANPEGTAFTFHLPDLASFPDGTELRLELMNGGTVWYYCAGIVERNQLAEISTVTSTGNEPV